MPWRMNLRLSGLKLIQDQSAKIVICCAYRHPDTDAGKFIEHFEHTSSKIDKNKVICVLGDFNINLLNINLQ